MPLAVFPKIHSFQITLSENYNSKEFYPHMFAIVISRTINKCLFGIIQVVVNSAEKTEMQPTEALP